jgi:hypothetical protein
MRIIYSGNDRFQYAHLRVGRWISPAIWRWAVCLIAVFGLSAGEGELSANAQKMVDSGLRSSAQIRVDYLKKIDAEKGKVIAGLKKELDSLTKAGKLEQAVAVKAYMEGLTSESWEASVNTTQVAGPGGFVANPEKVVARVRIDYDEKFQVKPVKVGTAIFSDDNGWKLSKVSSGKDPIPSEMMQYGIRKIPNYVVTVLTDGVVYVSFSSSVTSSDGLPDSVKWDNTDVVVSWGSDAVVKKAVVRAGQKFKITNRETRIMAAVVSREDEVAP